MAKHLAPIIQSYVDNPLCQGYIEPFCLSGDTILFTKEGIKTLEEIKVGDYIYDENCELKQIVEKYEIIKSGLAIHTKGNIDIKCSTDHPFYDEKTNKEILAKDILGVNLKKGFDKRKEHTKTIDLSNFITISKKKMWS